MQNRFLNFGSEPFPSTLLTRRAYLSLRGASAVRRVAVHQTARTRSNVAALNNEKFTITPLGRSLHFCALFARGYDDSDSDKQRRGTRSHSVTKDDAKVTITKVIGRQKAGSNRGVRQRNVKLKEKRAKEKKEACTKERKFPKTIHESNVLYRVAVRLVGAGTLERRTYRLG